MSLGVGPQSVFLVQTCVIADGVKIQKLQIQNLPPLLHLARNLTLKLTFCLFLLCKAATYAKNVYHVTTGQSKYN